MVTLVDYSAGVPPAAAIKAAGHAGAIRYISPARPDARSWMKGKPMSRREADDLCAHGLEIVSVWQYLKEDWRGGAKAGHANGKAAVTGHAAAGGPGGAVIYVAIDSNPTRGQWDLLIEPYVRAFAAELATDGHRLGLYCNSTCHKWARSAGIEHFWWAHRWGSDKTVSAAHIDQFEIDARSIAGIGVDLNRTQADDYGQWSKATGQPSTPREEKKMPLPEHPPYQVIDWTQRFTVGGPRSTGQIKRIYLHTSESPSSSTVEAVARYQLSEQNGSYHVLVDRTKMMWANTDDWFTWSNGNWGNQDGLHICFIGYAKATRAEWLAEEKKCGTLSRAAWVAAGWCAKYGLPPAFVDAAGLKAKRKGISTHNESRLAWGGTTHWDPGPGFPMDVFVDLVKNNMNTTIPEEGTFMPALSDDQQRQLASNVELILDQLAGPGRTPDGKRAWSGWDRDSILAAADSRTDAATLVEAVTVTDRAVRQSSAHLALKLSEQRDLLAQLGTTVSQLAGAVSLLAESIDNEKKED